MVTSPIYTGVELFSLAWFVFIIILVAPILFSNKLQEIMNTETVRVDPIDKWYRKALRELKHREVYDWSQFTFSPEAYLSVPFGVIWAKNKYDSKISFVFVDIRSGAKNLVVSKLESVDWQSRNKGVQSIQESAKIYLKLNEKFPLKTLDVQKNREVIVQ